ncbi:TetR/AcrR family transcriptional regulator [Microlunatus antarcticus]|uniref:AcrR family transcriptional regulator n=1 Tax=Microlunatus antarcticus TaxID=53388 RepID=A0A7W5P8V0_9ACTN|nr:TetR/AcrR family transcriptional regulator [Microlunatus antarcticus]MBB3329014.1 AcrR family transcriptional regulator [Microlunatus antarcticus]
MTSLAEVATPPTARRVRTRQRLMAAAVAVFAERGVIGSSVEEICEAAGFTRGAFYSNFADKDALVLAMIEQGVAEEYAAAEQAVASLKVEGARLPAGDAVAQVLDQLNHGGRSDRTSLLAQRELLLYAARVPSLREPYQAFADACRAQVDALITDALRFAELEFTVPDDVALDLLMAAHDHMQQNALFTDRLDPAAMQALIMTLTRPRVEVCFPRAAEEL